MRSFNTHIVAQLEPCTGCSHKSLSHQYTHSPFITHNDVFAGYLVSASNGVLNLWQCSCSFDEPALQLVHCLETEFNIADLQLDPASNLLLAAAKDMKATTECVAVHHLRMTPGIFRLNGRLGLPVGATGQRAKNPGAPVAMQAGSCWHYCLTVLTSHCCLLLHL